jgi:5-methyltetrahydrofolate--homocysteine methyltransferase
MADYESLVKSVIDGDETQVKEQTKALIGAGFKPLDIINQGLIAAMDIVGPRFRDG